MVGRWLHVPLLGCQPYRNSLACHGSSFVPLDLIFYSDDQHAQISASDLQELTYSAAMCLPLQNLQQTILHMHQQRLAKGARYMLPVQLQAFLHFVAGLYLVSAGTDSLLVLWDVSQRKALSQRSTPATVSAVSWHPDHNSLACISEEGSVAVWSDIVPGDHPGPHVSPDSLPAHGVSSPGEGGDERGGSVDPLGKQPCAAECSCTTSGLLHWFHQYGIALSRLSSMQTDGIQHEHAVLYCCRAIYPKLLFSASLRGNIG